MHNQSRNPDSLDFDFWKQLAKEDPDAFEALRREKIEQLINQAPAHHRRRLQGLQWQIDQTRRLAGGPMASCLAISNMMWDSLSRLNQQQIALLTAAPGPRPVATPPAASVVAFPARH